MAKNFQDFQQAVANRIQDEAGKIDQPALDDCIRKAIKGRYSQVRPRKLIKDFAGDGAAYDFTVDGTVFPGWVEEASYIRSLEYPAGEKNPAMLDSDDWLYPVQTSSTVRKLRLLNIIPQTGKTLRVSYTAPHAEADPLTVPDVDFEAVADLAASYACLILAAAYNQLVDPVFSAPTGGEHQSKSQHYLTLAKRFEAQWAGALGLDDETKQPAASGWASWASDGVDGSGTLTH